jgi:hypothetical protein
MLTHPILEQMLDLKLTGMHRALTEQLDMTDVDLLSFEERLGLLIDREMTERADRRLQYRLRTAKLRQSACIEDIDYRHRRGLDKRLMQKLASGEYLNNQLNVLITGLSRRAHRALPACTANYAGTARRQSRRPLSQTPAQLCQSRSHHPR